MREQRLNPDSAIARVAARQHGVVTVTQLYAAGIDKSGIARRVAAGRLFRLHRGVYAVGHAGLSRWGRWKAATLAVGDGAALSHRSAAELWGMLELVEGPAHVSVPVAGGRASRKGVRIHRCPSLTGALTTLRANIPVTRPTRTLIDLRRVVSPGEHRKALRQAEHLRLPIDDLWRASDRTASELEATFLYLCRKRHLPLPEVNAPLGPYLVDFLWRTQRLVVETDGYGSHRGLAAFEDDRERDNRLVALGYEVLRFTHRMVIDRPDEVMALVRARLSR